MLPPGVKRKHYVVTNILSHFGKAGSIMFFLFMRMGKTKLDLNNRMAAAAIAEVAVSIEMSRGGSQVIIIRPLGHGG